MKIAVLQTPEARSRNPLSPTSVTYEKRLPEIEDRKEVSLLQPLKTPESRLMAPRSPTMATYQKLGTKIPVLQIPSTPEPHEQGRSFYGFCDT